MKINQLVKSFLFQTTIFAMAFSTTAVAAETEGDLASPYFIDEVHCEGLRVDEVGFSWLMESEEEAASARKVLKHENCEAVLSLFGINKFSWMSDEDLERVSALAKQSGYFKEVDVSIKKSELKNHVHVFFNVTQAPAQIKTLSNEFRFYNGTGGEAPRIADQASFEILDRNHAPRQIFRYGANLMGTFAKNSSNNVDELTSEGASVEEISRFTQRNYQYGEIYFRSQGFFYENWAFDGGVSISADNIRADRTSGSFSLGTSLDASILKYHRNQIMKGTTYFGVAGMWVFHDSYTETTSTDPGASVIMPGIRMGYSYGNKLRNNLNFDLSAYSAFGKGSLFDYKLDGQYHLRFMEAWSPAQNVFLTGGLKWHNSDRIRLPQDLYPLASTDKQDFNLGLAKLLPGGNGSGHRISLVAGWESLMGDSDTSPIYEASPYIGAKYKFFGEEWNFNVGLAYHFSRNY